MELSDDNCAVLYLSPLSIFSITVLFCSLSTSPDKNKKIYWLLDEESGMTNGINPGSHGKLTFYVVPNQSGEMEIQFKLSITGYAENKNEDAVSYEKVTEEEVTRFMNGHIMFFEKYDENNHTYSDFLHDETFTRTLKDCKVGVPQEVNVYWVWPNTLGQILMKSTDENLAEKNVLFDDDSEERLNCAEYIKGNLSLFLSGDVAPIRHLRVVIAVKYLSFKHIGTAYCFQFKWRIYAFHSK